MEALPEEIQNQKEDHDQVESQSPSSAFSSKPIRPPNQTSSQKYSPLDWQGYFDNEDDVSIPNTNDVFHIYTAGNEGPVVLCLHGGGYSGLSFAISARIIKEKARVVAMDLRGHGKTSTENEIDMSIETLCSDVQNVVKTMYGDAPPAIVLVGHSMGGSIAVHVAAKKMLPSLAGLVVVDVVEGTAMASLMHMQKILSNRVQHFPTIEKATLCSDVQNVVKTMYGDAPPAIVLVGHSMGGSIAVHVAAKKMLPSLAGLVVVDVVEGTAMASLMHMQKILSNRVQHFPTIEKAIEWNVRAGSLGNIESARISIPGTVKYDDSQHCYRHRARLEETEQYWRGWYEGLSEKFLSSPVAKLLLLAGTDRLDRALTIGQMQGKFQMVVVRHTGHAIQEDAPDEFAALILNFISRNRISPHGVEIPGIRKLSQPHS